MGILAIKELFSSKTQPSEVKQQQEAEEDLLKALYHAGVVESSDALKHIAYERGLSLTRLERSIGALVLRGELQTQPYKLSQSGTERALRLIRAHRIYEKYLAEHSGYKPEDWHRLANRMEHHISPEEQNRMASLLRNPLYDPHGDPIPTTNLDLPSSLDEDIVPPRAGAWFRVLHIEDDDLSIFSLINAQNIARHSIIYIEKLCDEWCELRYEGESICLPRGACSALSLTDITLSADEIECHQQTQRLTNLSEGEEALIVGLSPSCHGAMRRRLMDLGFVKGSRVSIEMESPMHNPIAYVVRGTAIALRADQAQYILINKYEQ